MNQKDFNQTVKARIRQTESLLLKKGKEYAGKEREGFDRLRSFKDGASFLKETPKQCLMGFTTKHLTAIVDFVERDAKGEYISHEQWDEKIGDVIAYMHILEAIVVEGLHEAADV